MHSEPQKAIMGQSAAAERLAYSFFDTYKQALLDRDAIALSEHYAMPALIEFPHQTIVVENAKQTEEFFASAFAQYTGVTKADVRLQIVASTSYSIWVDASWDHHGGAPDERNMYQLALRSGEWKISVLTPLAAEE